MQNELHGSLETLHEKFKSIEPSLALDEKRSELNDLQQQTQDPEFWNDPDNAQRISQKVSHIGQFLSRWVKIKEDIHNLKELLEMSTEDEDAEDLSDLQTEVERLNKEFEQGEVDVLLSEEYDMGNAIISLHVGNGGQDAEDFCQMLYRMYLRFAERHEWRIEILEESTSDVGLKSAMFEVKGPMAYGLCKSEHGVHRLIRLSPFNAKSLRQTSFARVEVLPEIHDTDEVIIDEKDLRVDVFRSSGCGGQSVNTTDSAVRITYLPLNIVVTCQNEKSQLQNKQSAMKVLQSRLLKLKLEQKAEKINELRGDMMENSFGSQIRTYTLQPYKLVKDHRTDFEHAQPDKVFDGELEGFVESYLRNL